MVFSAEVETMEEEIEEILDEVEDELEDQKDTQGIPGWMPLYGIIGAGVVAFVTGFIVVVKYSKCKREQPKLLN